MYNKSKHHQSVKVEKENENIKLRKRTKNLNTDKQSTNKKESVWDRLSKIRKASSSEKVSEEENMCPDFVAKSRQRLHSMDNMLVKKAKQTSNKPLIQGSNAVKRHLNFSQKAFLKKPQNCNSILIPFEDIISSHGLNNDPKFSSDGSASILKFPTDRNDLIVGCSDRKNKEFSEASIEEYTLAPLLTSHSEDRAESFGDNNLLINVVKSSNRCEILKDNPKFLRDFSKTQLQNILTEDFVVEEVLNKLPSSDKIQHRTQKDLPEQTDNIVEYLYHPNEVQKFEVVFKNVPSLHKEIKMLRAICEKLETTLKSTNIHRIRQTSISQISVNSTMKSSAVMNEKNASVLLKVKHDFKTEHFVLVSIQLSGICQCAGIIKEFSVARKSIVELKREASLQFFIRSNCENLKLVKTSYKNLKENPNELFRHVRPKKSQIAFNLLEQDPIYFYSALSKPSQISRFLFKKHNQNNEHHQLVTNQRGESFYGTTSKNETEIIVSCNSKSNNKCNSENDLFKTQTNSESIVRDKKRRRIRHLVTPMPIDYYHCPKNSIIKTILVGFVQVSLFIVFIVALTHPSLRCLNSTIYT